MTRSEQESESRFRWSVPNWFAFSSVAATVVILVDYRPIFVIDGGTGLFILIPLMLTWSGFWGIGYLLSCGFTTGILRRAGPGILVSLIAGLAFGALVALEFRPNKFDLPPVVSPTNSGWPFLLGFVACLLSPTRMKPMGPKKKLTKKTKLLSGGNPQIPKADGDEPVQAYIAAMPDWKGEVGRELDALVMRTVPEVRKAVRWNSPFYGMEGKGWFLSYHCFNKYVKVTFLNGSDLRPLPPEESKHEATRYLHIHEGEAIDAKQFSSWIRQASKLPGDELF